MYGGGESSAVVTTDVTHLSAAAIAFATPVDLLATIEQLLVSSQQSNFLIIFLLF